MQRIPATTTFRDLLEAIGHGLHPQMPSRRSLTTSTLQRAPHDASSPRPPALHRA